MNMCHQSWGISFFKNNGFQSSITQHIHSGGRRNDFVTILRVENKTNSISAVKKHAWHLPVWA